MTKYANTTERRPTRQGPPPQPGEPDASRSFRGTPAQPTERPKSPTYDTPAYRQERRRQAREDLRTGAPELQRKALELCMSAGLLAAARAGRKPHPPGLADQLLAAQERRWWLKEARRLLKAHRRHHRRAGRTVYTYAVTLVRSGWIAQRDDLSVERLKQAAKAIQRGARRLDPETTLVLGMLEASYNVDRDLGLLGWYVHGHLTVQIAAATREEAEALIHRAFPYRADPKLGVFKPIDVTEVWWRRGWLLYSSKGLQLHAVTQRVVHRPDGGDRTKAKDRPLTQAQAGAWARLLSGATANDFTIWVGRRRYPGRKRTVACHP